MPGLLSGNDRAACPKLLMTIIDQEFSQVELGILRG